METSLVRCRACHAVYQSPTLLPSGNPYIDVAGSYFRHDDPGLKRDAGTILARKAESLLGRRGRLLELGCGPGDVLDGARAAGWSVAGIDMTAAFAEAGRARGIPIEVSSVEESQVLNEVGEFDVVLLAAILEHVYAPASVLERVRNVLRPGGIIFIDVPNECSLFTFVANAYQRVRLRDWVVNMSPTFPPFHVVGFCPASLTFLLDRVGFRVAEMSTHAWDVPTEDLARFERVAVRAVNRVGCWLGKGVGLTAWAIRTERI